MKSKMNKVDQTSNNNSWSQFERWAGINWFSKKPATPPRGENDRHPITCNCPDCCN